MANDYMDYWELNGDTVLLQDFGKGKSNGVAVLDENGKIQDTNIPVIYSSKLITSKKDSNHTPLKNWVDAFTQFAVKDYGQTYEVYDEEYQVYAYYDAIHVVLGYKASDTPNRYDCYLRVGEGEWHLIQEDVPYSAFIKIAYYTKNGIIGFTRDITYQTIRYYDLNSYQYKNDGVITFITPSGTYTNGYSSPILINNKLFRVRYFQYPGSATIYMSLLISENGKDWTEVIYSELSGTLVSNYYTLSGAYGNGKIILKTPYVFIRIENNNYYIEELTPIPRIGVDYSEIVFFKDVFTTGYVWSIDGVTWNATNYEEVFNSSEVITSTLMLPNKVLYTTQKRYGYYTTEDGKILVDKSADPIIHPYESYAHDIGIQSQDNGIVFGIVSVDVPGSTDVITALFRSCNMNKLEIVGSFISDAHGFGSCCDNGTAFFTDGTKSYKTIKSNVWLPYNNTSTYVKENNNG